MEHGGGGEGSRVLVPKRCGAAGRVPAAHGCSHTRTQREDLQVGTAGSAGPRGAAVMVQLRRSWQGAGATQAWPWPHFWGLMFTKPGSLAQRLAPRVDLNAWSLWEVTAWPHSAAWQGQDGRLLAPVLLLLALLPGSSMVFGRFPLFPSVTSLLPVPSWVPAALWLGACHRPKADPVAWLSSVPWCHPSCSGGHPGSSFMPRSAECDRATGPKIPPWGRELQPAPDATPRPSYARGFAPSTEARKQPRWGQPLGACRALCLAALPRSEGRVVELVGRCPRASPSAHTAGYGRVRSPRAGGSCSSSPPPSYLCYRCYFSPPTCAAPCRCLRSVPCSELDQQFRGAGALVLPAPL